MPPELKFPPPPPKSTQPQDRVGDVTELFKKLTAEETGESSSKMDASTLSVTPQAHALARPSAKESKLTARLPAPVHHRLRVHAAMQGKTIEEFVIVLLDEHLPRGLGEGEL